MVNIGETNKLFWDICEDFKNQTNIKKNYLEYISALLYIKYANHSGIMNFKYLFEQRTNYYIAEYIDRVLRETVEQEKNRYLFQNVKFREIIIYRNIGEENILGIIIKRLYELINELEKRYGESKRFIANAYHYALIECASKKDINDLNGEIYTPTGIAKVMIELININKGGVVNDPSCGSGNILLNLPQNNNLKVFAKEEELGTYNLCITNLMLNEIDYKNVEFDDFKRDNMIGEPKKIYDYIITNPPFIERNIKSRFIHNQKIIREYDIRRLAPGDYGYIINMLDSLNKAGKMAIILPHGVLFRTTERIVRKKLIENNYIDAIIGLPENMFFGTRISVIIMILNKEKANKDILFIDASNEYVTKKKINIFSLENQTKIINTYKNREEIKGFSYVASIDEIMKTDYNLTIKKFIKKQVNKKSINKEEIMKQLESLEKEKDILEENIKDVLEKLEEKEIFVVPKKKDNISDIDYEQIGNNIKIARRNLNYTMEQLAEKLDISIGFLSRIERGATKISLDRLVQISEILGIPLEEVLRNKEKISTDNSLESNTDKILKQITQNDIRAKILRIPKEIFDKIQNEDSYTVIIDGKEKKLNIVKRIKSFSGITEFYKAHNYIDSNIEKKNSYWRIDTNRKIIYVEFE